MSKDVNAVQVRKILRTAMNECGKSRAEVADRLGGYPTAVSNNITRPKVGADVMVKMLNAMGYVVTVGKQDGAGTFEPLWELTQDE